MLRGGSAAALFCALLAHAPQVLADFPIASHRYLADPGALVSNERVYLYNSNDDDNPVAGGYQMKSIVCVSSSDLVNWTDHGEVFRVPNDAGWANDSWAPAAIERNGLIYLYFGNNAGGIGVASSAAPTGPFRDARGSALVDSSTPGASGTNSWLFDPSVFIDDDGQAYLSFGGNGDSNARIIPLNSDMVSVAGSAVALTVPDYFEASWIFKKDGLYYFTYSTTPATGQRIDYLTSTSPSSGFSYRGVVAAQPPSNDNNNHHSMFQLGGSWYHAYHNRIVATQAGIPTTYRRNLGLERLVYNPDGTVQPVVYTTDGGLQLASLNPYVRVEAETTNAQGGIETEPCSAGGMDVTELQSGDWLAVRGVDFGSAGAQGFHASVASATNGGSIELRLDSLSGTLIGTCTVPGTGGTQIWVDSSCSVSGATGVHDLYLVFTGDSSPLFNVDYWQFTTNATEGAGTGSGGDGGNGGSTSSPAGPDGAGGTVTASGTRERGGCRAVPGASSSTSSAAAAVLMALLLALRKRR
jgi:arabinoxylan arabinofuranohydrolase